MATDHLVKLGRLAYRHEGKWWVAYYALPDTMEKSIQLGRIKMTAIEGRPERKQQFMDLLRDVVADIIEETSGRRPEWLEPTAAPESERSGHA